MNQTMTDLEEMIRTERDLETLRRLALIAVDAWRNTDTTITKLKEAVESFAGEKI